MRLLLLWLINTAAILALPHLLESVRVDSLSSAFMAALVLGLVNTVIRPIVILLTLPVTFLSLGLFIFIINGLMFWVVADLVTGFQVASFGSAVLAAFVYSVLSWLMSAILIRK